VWQCHSALMGKKGSESIKLQGDGGRALSDNEASTVANDRLMNKVDRIREEMAEGGNPIFQTKRRAQKLGTASVNHDQVWGRQLYGLRPASIRQVRKSIKKAKKAKNSTAMDLDGLSPNMIKLGGEVVLAPLADLITRSFAEGKVPEGWKEARVVPVHKKGAKQDIKNYSPVSILRVGSKIIEDVACGQLSKHHTNISTRL
jgi:hypothetical protein